MEAPPLLVERGPNLQLVLSIAVPAFFGAVAGILLGVSEGAYVIFSALAILGGIGAGYEHASPGEGAMRGLAGGSLFGVFILLAHEISGMDAKAELPEPHAVLVVFTTVFGVALGALGGFLRARHERRHPAAA
jgi:hypothetical protein